MNSEFRVLVRPAPESTAICPSDVERRRFRRKTCLSDLKEQEYARKAYKPDFVPALKQAMTIPLTAPLPMQLKLPTRTCWGRRAPPLTRRSSARGPYLALLPVGLAMPELLPAPRWALTPPFHPYPCGCSGKPDRRGGFISVALSVGLPRPGVTRHRSFLESGLSSTSPLPRKSDAADATHACDGSGRRSCDTSRRSGHPAFRA